METWFLNHVLGLLLLVSPGPLGAWTPPHTDTATDRRSSRDPVTGGYYQYYSHQPAGTEGAGAAENKVLTAATSHSSESLLPSGGDVPHTHTAETHTAAAGNLATEQTQTLQETNSWSQEKTAGPSTEPFVSTVVATTEPSNTDWEDLPTPDRLPDFSPAFSVEPRPWTVTEEGGLPRDSPESSLRLGDATGSASSTALGVPVRTDSTYFSTTVSRAGERTLLSVTLSTSGNSTSSVFTEDTNSRQPPSTWGVPVRGTESEDYTNSVPSTSANDRDTTRSDPHLTHSFSRTFSETESPGMSRGTHALTGRPNSTEDQPASTSEGTPNSTPPLRVTGTSTDQSDMSVSSTPPGVSPDGRPANVSGTVQGSGSSVGTSTESSTGSLSSSSSGTQGGTERVSSQTEEVDVGAGLTTALPTVRTSITELDDSLTRFLSGQPPFIPKTDGPVSSTEVFLTTTPVTVAHRSQVTEEEETFKAAATTASTPTPPPSSSSSGGGSSSSSSSGSSSPTQGSPTLDSITTPPATVSTLGQQTSTAAPAQPLSPSHTQGPSTGMAGPVNVTVHRPEVSTATQGVTMARGVHTTTATTTATSSPSTPTRSTAAPHITRKQTDRGTTEPAVTTAPTEFQPTKAPPRNPCAPNPCMNGGMCVSHEGREFTCRCLQAWTGLNCSEDANECEQDPCPPGSRCVNTQGSFSCKCPLGFDLHDGRTCTRAKTFLGTFSVNRQPHDLVEFRRVIVHEIQREIIQLLNASLSVLHGYSRSTLSNSEEEDGLHISAVNMFSVSTEVTSAEVFNSIQMSLSNCSSSSAHCRMVLHHKLTYQVESLCLAQKTPCDTERSTCTDSSGTAYCQCLQGYYKHNPEDLSCIECGDGYKLENGTCVQCMFGFGGFNCGNFYKLIAVVVSPAGGGLLLILIIALIVTCCRKDKNDINKIIFKSGDLQMSPYTDFPKSSRVSMEWGRETIEMQENGSTKNLLQMTDIYYSPALRNSDLERNGLYPFTGLPGSRHSCIYPAQWNPSFISDDSRRRDYF
ncbi:protein HEG [Myripristis murdjan]|uniref:protein HEG n=1 Tax=Myripristis murdjan TaxID=586833 RepID=UPI001175D5AA|nr:protein HEG-like [Myripristis murdjan]